jgi:plastocyanin
LVSEWNNPGVPVPDALIPLDPAAADSVLVNLTQPGVFLFHCHVVTHADAGMIGVLVVLGANGTVTSNPRAATSVYTLTTSNSSVLSTTSLTAGGSGAQVQIVPNAGITTTSPGYSPQVIHVVIGVNNTVTWTNNDSTVHSITANDQSFDSGPLNAGQIYVHQFTTPGTYQYHCIYHAWMNATVIVSAPG